MRFIYFSLQGFLSLLLCYASFVSIYISFIKNRQFNSLTLFFVLTLFSFSCLQSYKIYRLIKKEKLFKKAHLKNPFYILKNNFKQNKKLSAVLTLCLISLLIGFFNVSTQYSRGVGNNSVLYQFNPSPPQNTIEASYRQQQPPLDYYFSSFSKSLFGQNKFAIRFHAMTFYLILSFILPLILWFFCSSLWITSMGTLLFLINHIVRLHSVEGRPLCLALLTGFLFLFFYLSYCKQSQSDEKSLFPVLASQYLFAMSIGLQPIIFIVSLFISSFWLLFKNKKDTFKKLFLTNIFTGILTLPFYIKMLIFGKSAYKFKQVSLESINSYFTNLDIFYFLEKYFFSFYEQTSPSFLILAIGLLTLMFTKKVLDPLILMILSSLLLFPLLYDAIFHIGLIWFGLFNWYIITFSLFLILFVVLSLKEIDKYFISKRWRIYFGLPFFLLFTGNTVSQIQAIKNETQFKFPYRDNSVEQVYDYLKKKGGPKDVAVQFSLRPVVAYRSQNINFKKIFFYNPDFHPIIINFYIEYTKTTPFFHEAKGDRIYYINWQDIPKKEFQKVFFISYQESEDDMAYSVLSSLMEGHKIGRYAVFALTLSSQNKEKEYIQFLAKINKKTTKKYKGAVLETLIYYAYKNKNKKKFNHLLQEYENIEMSLDEFLPDNEYPSRFELRRRVKYFENLKWDTED